MRCIAAICVASVALAAVLALAQNSGKMWRLGVLTLPTSPSSPVFETFRSVMFPELAKQGYVEDSNLVFEVRMGAPDRLPELARELVATRPDVVIAVSSWAIDAVQQASNTTPIVGSFIGVDPIAAGYATSLARPGGNITGIVMLAPELDGKRINILHPTLPRARRVAALARSRELEASSLVEMEKAAAEVGLELVTFYAGAPEEFPAAFVKMHEANMEALAIASVPEFAGNAATLATQAIASHLPTVCEWDWMAQDGCLLGYGPDFTDLRRRPADYVVRIFRGASPGELPMEQPTHFKFTVNLKTGAALGLSLPPAILARADEVIE
jgi:putative ABC transport system substrate-binding protein